MAAVILSARIGCRESRDELSAEVTGASFIPQNSLLKTFSSLVLSSYQCLKIIGFPNTMTSQRVQKDRDKCSNIKQGRERETTHSFRLDNHDSRSNQIFLWETADSGPIAPAAPKQIHPGQKHCGRLDSYQKDAGRKDQSALFDTIRGLLGLNE